jgi:pimeloyl-ACP methyl ester carboxylesterase/DNA-binding winged helix-turn-helix (wHTH) protein
MVYVFGQYELDTLCYELRRDGERCPLEPQVYGVLCHLVENRERVVSRDELLDRVWGHRFVTPAALSTRIKGARQALGDDGATQQMILTVRSRGFRFIAPVQVRGPVPADRGAGDRAGGAEEGGIGPEVEGRRRGGTAPATGTQRIRICRADDGVRIAYATTGTGPPLVKTANWLTHLEYDWDSPVWRHWLRELSRDHTLVRYDERGCGLSDRAVDDLSFQAWVRDLETVVDALALERFDLLAISQGAAVALVYAALHPERVKRLVIVGGFARGRGHRPDGASHVDEELLKRMIPLGWGRDNPAFRHFFARLFLPGGTEEQIGWFSEMQRRSASPAEAARLLNEFYEVDASAEVDRVRAPTLVFHARHDAVVPFEAGRRLAARMDNARFVPLDSQNHLLLEDEPAWPRFVEEVRAFVGGGE